MELFTLLIISTVPFALSSEDAIEPDCLACIRKEHHTFYKVIWAAAAPTDYVCRSAGTLISKFGHIVDSACDEMDCQNISSRPLLRNSRRYDYFDCRLQETIETKNRHAKLVQIIRDYLEIILMSIVCGILVLKKKILLQCIKSHWTNEPNIISPEKKENPGPALSNPAAFV
jgi:hypothetical protein